MSWAAATDTSSMTSRGERGMGRGHAGGCAAPRRCFVPHITLRVVLSTLTCAAARHVVLLRHPSPFPHPSLLLFDPEAVTWSKLQTRGLCPSTLIYHSATALERDYPRHVLVFGGSTQHNVPDTELVHVLDSLTLSWDRPKVLGPCPEQRTRHTMIAVHPNPGVPHGTGAGGTNLILFGGYSPTARLAYNDVWALHVRPHRGASGTTRHAAADAASSGGDGGSGGFGDDGGSGSGGGGSGDGGGDGGGGGGGGGLGPHRVRPPVPRDAQPGERSGGGSGGEAHPYEYSWTRVDKVEGVPPDSRLAHTATAVPLPAAMGGTRMVVFGGVGLGAMFRDVHILACGDVRQVRWEGVSVAGAPPHVRYGHTMSLIEDRVVEVSPSFDGSSTVEEESEKRDGCGGGGGVGARKHAPSSSKRVFRRPKASYSFNLVVFGGTTGQAVFKDIHVLSIDPDSLAAGPIALATGEGGLGGDVGDDTFRIKVQWTQVRWGDGAANGAVDG